jgi:transposase
MGEYSEAFVAFDVSKTKYAVAIADGGRGSEVRFSVRWRTRRRRWSG